MKSPLCTVGKVPWRRKWQPTAVFLPRESHGQRSLAGYSPRGRKKSDTTERLILILRRGLYETSRDNGAILKTTTRWQQNPGVQVRRTESHGRPHSRQEGWVSLSLPHPHHSPHPPHTETHGPAPAPTCLLFPRPGTVLYILNMAKVSGLQTWLQIWITRGAL